MQNRIQIVQENMLQYFVGYFMRCAGLPAGAHIASAVVEGVGRAVFFGERTAAVAALQKACKHGRTGSQVEISCPLFQQVLCFLPGFHFDNGVVRALYDNPVFFLFCFGLSSHMLCFPTLYHISDIQFILQNAADGRVAPERGSIGVESIFIRFTICIFISGWTENAFLIQESGDAELAVPAVIELKNLPNDGGGVFINDKFVFIGRRFPIAIGSKSADKFSGLLLGSNGSVYLPGDVPRILFIEYIFNRKEHVISLYKAVDMVRDGNKPDILFRKIAFQISSGLNIIASEAGQVFYDDAVHLTVFDIVYHPPKCGAVVGYPG